MNIAVVDDEEIIRQQIHGFIKKQKPESEISDFSTGEGLLAAGREFDIIFLDCFFRHKNLKYIQSYGY